MKALHIPHLQTPKVLSVAGLLRPHWKAMTMAMVGVAGIAVTELLEPWPLKIVIDNLLQDRPLHGWVGTAAGWIRRRPACHPQFRGARRRRHRRRCGRQHLSPELSHRRTSASG